ncbi:hypothetical protein [Acholeplasma hippikon]|uniref:Alcohol acetyltransferase n=1 Tax=Acholeplasma hippikon TaxID=264636 RepID=A0A449BJJ6_9MOLU|nr:hypothetical protein [Acholeplasma hippikon]VEU82636.1 Uncharacterised protein [Acholeplasma hippikon]
MAKLQKYYDLDNAAKIFPVVANESRTYMFRISVVFKEEINREVLVEALVKTTKRFRHMNVRLRRGLFWHFYEENKKNPILYEDTGYVNEFLYFRENNDFLFRTMYYKQRLTVEYFHALTDGKGALEFINSLAFEYLNLLGKEIEPEGLIKTIDSLGNYQEIEDQFKKLYHKKKIKKAKEPKAHHLKGTNYANNYNAVMHLYLSVEKMKAVVKAYNCTVTEFFAASLILAAKRSGGLDKYKHLFRLFIPVNMRQYFPSVTMRNFISYFRINYDLNQNDLKLEQVITDVKRMMKEELNVERMIDQIVENVKIEKNFLLRAVPLPVKVVAMRSAYGIVGEALNSYVISNLGKVTIPKKMESFISHYQFIITPSNDTPKVAAVISYQDTLCISFISKIVEREFEQAFVKILSENGLSMQIEANNWEVL